MKKIPAPPTQRLTVHGQSTTGPDGSDFTIWYVWDHQTNTVHNTSVNQAEMIGWAASMNTFDKQLIRMRTAVLGVDK